MCSTTYIATCCAGMSEPISSTIFSASGNLLVSSFFAQVLLDAGLATSDLTGANVGSADITAYMSDVIPAPGAIALLGMGGILVRRRRC